MDEPLENLANDGAQFTSVAQRKNVFPANPAPSPSAIAGWLIPGLGHAPAKDVGSRLWLYFIAVGLLIFAGASMKGNVFTHQGNDAF